MSRADAKEVNAGEVEPFVSKYGASGGHAQGAASGLGCVGDEDEGRYDASDKCGEA